MSHPITPRLRILALAVAGLAGAFSGTASAQSGMHSEEAKRLEADFKSAMAAQAGKWVELPTGGWSIREYVAELRRNNDDNSVLVHLRTDYMTEASDGAATNIETTWLYCDTAQQRVVAVHGYDLQGRQVFSNAQPDNPLQPIERPYAGAPQLICSELYRLLAVDHGFQRYGEIMAARRDQRAKRLADRPVPDPLQIPTP